MHDDFWATNGGFYLGYPVDWTEGPPPNFLGQRPLQMASDRSITVISPNGAGKSRRILLPQLASLLDWSIVVVDFKGELCRASADYRRERGSEIVILNPFDVFGMGSHGFNPVASLDPRSDEFVDDAMGLAEALVTIRNDPNPHFPASAQDLIAALLLFSRLVDPDGGSLGHVRQRLGLPALDFVEEVDRMQRVGIEKECEALTTKAGRFRDLTSDSEELNSIISTAATQTRWIDSPKMQKDLEKGAYSWADMKDRPITTYLVLPGNRMSSHRGWVRLMLTAITQQLMKSVARSKTPVLLMIDEASQITGTPAIEENLAMFRGYGVRVLSVYQDYPQAELALGRRVKSYLANSGILIAFAPQDDDTASLLSKRSGQTTIDTLTFSTPAEPIVDDKQQSSLSISPAKRPVMLPHEFMNMDEGFAAAFTHKTKGTLRTYFPDPSELPQLAALVARMP